MPDVLILGGGVIGLSLAYELSGRGRTVAVIEQNAEIGRESSWAGAGILPDAAVRSTAPPLEQLAGHAFALHRQWADRLRQATGIDNGYRVCGAVYLGQDAATLATLEAEAAQWREQGLNYEPVDAGNVAEIEPALAPAFAGGEIRRAYYMPNESQVRNPRHMQALYAACVKQGVTFHCDAVVQDFVVAGGKLTEVRTARGPFSAAQIVLAGGAWTGRLGEKLGLKLGVRPIRGQIALLHPPKPVVRRTIMLGRRYLVPRDDGRILIGSTEEDVGFDKSNTAAVIADLLQFAVTLVPQLRDAPLERTWAGLRPYSADDLPYLGAVPNLSNAFVAAGHYRWGLTLSTATAVCLTQLLLGEQPLVDLHAFRLDR
jgi:glycine oxidase